MLSQTMTDGIPSVMSSKAVRLSRILQSSHQPAGRTGNEPRALVVRRRLSEIRLVQLLSLEQVGYDTKRSPVTLRKTEHNRDQLHISYSHNVKGRNLRMLPDLQYYKPSTSSTPLQTHHSPLQTPRSNPHPIFPWPYSARGRSHARPSPSLSPPEQSALRES